VDDGDWLAKRFEANRTHLRAVAYRMLGSQAEAEDAVQEAWLRASRAGTDGVDNLGGWLTTVVGRVCLDMLRTRRSRREDLLDETPPAAPGDEPDPEREAVLADSIGLALLVVLDTLAPAERLAFVLHDMFGVPFDEVGTIVDRSPAAARQLASRARRRVQDSTVPDTDLGRQRRVVEAFLAASREGDFEALLDVLDPDAVVRADSTAAALGAAPELRGADAVVRRFAGQARGARLALVGGAVGAAWVVHGTTKVAFEFTIEDDRIVAIDLIGDPDRLAALDVAKL